VGFVDAVADKQGKCETDNVNNDRFIKKRVQGPPDIQTSV
jgi:hypothetical protein